MNVYYAYVPKNDMLDIYNFEYNDSLGIVFKKGTVFTKQYLYKKKGYKRVSVDFDIVAENNEWNVCSLKEHFERHEESFAVQTDYVEICEMNWEMRGVEILDRMRLHPSDGSNIDLPSWLPVRKLTVTSLENTINDKSFEGHSILRDVRFDLNMEYIGCLSFSSCSRLEKAVIGEKAFFGYAHDCFCSCPSLSTVIIVPSSDKLLKMNEVYPGACSYKAVEENGNTSWFVDCPKLSELIVADMPHRIKLVKK